MISLISKAWNAIQRKIYWKFYSFFIDKTFEPKMSYSQNGEDIIISGIFESLSRHRIFYLDIGGYHPYSGSNTALFYQTGSNGIVVEPNPELFRQFSQKRPRDISLNIGVSTYSGDQDFYLSPSGALGSLIKDESVIRSDDERIESLTVPVLTVQDIVTRYADGKDIDYISMDIEGMELPVLESIDFSLIHPIVFCIETIHYSKNRKKEKRVDILNFMEKKGYFIYADTYINTIFVRQDVWDLGNANFKN